MVNPIKKILSDFHLTQRQLSEALLIPRRTVEDWCRGVSTPPDYVVDLIRFRVCHIFVRYV